MASARRPARAARADAQRERATAQLNCRGRIFALDRPLLMGVINLTPDSFSDGGRYDGSLEAALAHAEHMLEHGADILDVGGESTRPGARVVSPSEELQRILPLVTALLRRGACVSVDTRHAETMRVVLECGVHLINDVRALQEPGALEVVARSGAAVCLMHMQGEPATMQLAPAYDDVVGEVGAFLDARARACVDAGIPRESILVDPGFGFGKTLQHNLALLRSLSQLRALGWPILAGLSRKSMLGPLTGRPVESRLAGSLALAQHALARGASVLRVHDVAETRDLIRVWNAVEHGES